MALLDLTTVLREPLFTSRVRLFSREMEYDHFGEPVFSETNRVEVDAIVTSDQKALERLPDAIRRAGTIVVRVASGDLPRGFEGKAHDSIEWRGKTFSVIDSSDNSHIGAGFIKLICAPEEANDGSY